MIGTVVTDFLPGTSIKEAVEELQGFKNRGISAQGKFNAEILTSEMSLDEAYKLITGKTYNECVAQEKEQYENYKREEQDHKDKMPELVVEWNRKGEKILDPEYLDKWYDCVPIRLGDVYRGMELGACLELVDALNSNQSFDDVSKILSDQGHSGMSHGLVCSMVKSFSKRGVDFLSYLKMVESVAP